MSQNPTPPESGRSLPLRTLIACCLAICIAQTALAIPATLNGLLQSSLHTTGSQLTWISDATLLPVAVLELTFGVLGDLFGRKRLLVGGALLLAVGEALSAGAGGVHYLWAGQALAGVGAAGILPSSLAMVAVGTRTAKHRATAIAAWSACLAAGGFVAPMLGGITGNYGSWRWSFIVLAMLGVVSAAVGLIARDSRAPQGRSLDLPGQLTIGIGLFALLYAVIQGPTDGWGAAPVVTAFLIAAVFLALFVVAELRSAAPLLQLDLFRNRAFSVAAAVAVTGIFSFIGTCYALSIRLGPIQHQSPLRIAVAFLFTNGPTLVLAPVTARLLHRVSARWLLSGGFLLIAAGDLLLARLPVTDLGLPSLIAPLILIGLGFTLAVSSITATAVNTVPISLAGMASGVTSQLRDFGATLGPALIGAVALSRAATGFNSALAGSPLPIGVKAAVGQIATAGGPLAVNSLPPQSPPGAAAPLALHALGDGYSTGFLVCGAAALLSCLLAGLVLHGSHGRVTAPEPDIDTLAAPAIA
ncbi:MFS transporter [Streptacidiphilus sp. N1-10]|uniref:MFS transporter n=1 Tax=Streptacidiphilus jeojiensis TaxID=3229225 RepID=A0ABV6XNH4_9ACTN